MSRSSAAYFQSVSARASLIPVLVIEEPDTAVSLANALGQGGACAVEVTLRTEGALDAITRMKTACPDLQVGAGTVLSEGDIDACRKAGVDFMVTPGTSPDLSRALLDCDVPVCPGISSASEAMTLKEMGYSYQKFFPAEAAGGAPYLKALSGPLRQISFMPTGGVTTDNLAAYIALDNVFAVGGSWIAPNSLIDDGNYDAITQRMADALRRTA